MAGLLLYVLFFIPMAAVSVAVAVLPVRPALPRLLLLTGHVAASVALVMLMPGPEGFWVMIFGPGLAVSALRLPFAVVDAYRRVLPAGRDTTLVQREH